MLRDRKPATVRAELAAMLDQADVWLLQEAEDYGDLLRQLTFDGWTWHAGKGSQASTGVLYRSSLPVTAATIVPASKSTWYRGSGKAAPPSWLAVVDIAGVRCVSVKTPPRVERGGRHPILLAPRRWRVYQETMTAVAAAVEGRARVVVGGDWNVNALADKGGRWFPRSFMSHLNLRREDEKAGVLNRTPTHGSRLIDSLWARGVKLTRSRALPRNGSDHRAVVADYTL